MRRRSHVGPFTFGFQYAGLPAIRPGAAKRAFVEQHRDIDGTLLAGYWRGFSRSFPEPDIPMHWQWLARADTSEVGMVLINQNVPFYQGHHGGHNQYWRASLVIPSIAEGPGGYK
jgi:hypothetical protein